MRKLVTTLFAFWLVAILAVPALSAMRPINFGVPPWPGAMMKAQVAAMVLEAAGYQTSMTSMGVSEIYKGLENGEVDVYMSAWLPTQSSLLQPLIETKKVRVAGVNVSGAQVGLCVPGYVHAAGIKSITDLAPNSIKFGSTLIT